MNNCKFCIVTPSLSCSEKSSRGFNEMLCSEIEAVLEKQDEEYIVCSDNTIKNYCSQIYIFVIQYREEVFSDILRNNINNLRAHKQIAFICGKSASVEYHYILKYLNADFVFLGEVEKTLSDIIKISKKKNSIQYSDFFDVEGIAYFFDGKIEKRKRFISEKNMDDLPFPKYQYLRNKGYSVCVLESSRSCHGKCNFCEGYLFRKFTGNLAYRAKSPERITDEMKYIIQTYGTRIFAFSDDNFFCDGNYGKERALKIAEIIINKNLKNRFTIECRADDIDYEIFRILKKAGLRRVFVGLESGSQRVLDRYNKGTTVEDNCRAIEILHSLNIQCVPGYILFDPKTTLEELKETIRFFNRYKEILCSDEGNMGQQTLFFPQNSAIVYDLWPQRDEKFYEKMWYGEIEEKFEDIKVLKIYNKFCQNLIIEQDTGYVNEFSKKIYCLEKALKEV